jgi:hypothetical protein
LRIEFGATGVDDDAPFFEGSAANVVAETGDPGHVAAWSLELVGASRTASCDIISDIMWQVELEPEVEVWLDSMSISEFAVVLPHIEQLAERGNALRMPASRALGDGLFELRFELNRVAWRIPFFFAGERRIVLLTVFRKQRMNERNEVLQARTAMQRCIAEGHTAEE